MARLDPTGLHAAQAGLLARFREALGGGATRLGWKIGLNDPRTQRFYRLPHPVVGYMTGASLIRGDASFEPGRLLMAEPELAIRIDREFDPAEGAAGASRAIGAIAPAIEVLDFEQPRESIDDIMRHNIFHLGVAVGGWEAPGAHRRGHVRLLANGEVLDEAAVGDALPPLEDIVHLVGRTLVTHGERLHPGDVIISGAMTRPVPLVSGQPLDASYAGLGRMVVERLGGGRVQVRVDRTLPADESGG